MAKKQRPDITVTKSGEGWTCDGCDKARKCTAIETGKDKVTVYLCSVCLNWLKGKLRGF